MKTRQIKMFLLTLMVAFMLSPQPVFSVSLVSQTLLSHQKALEQFNQINAQNIANINTDGYQEKGIIFSEYVLTLDRSKKNSMVESFATYHNTDVGSIEYTGNIYDFALASKGHYFVIAAPEGERYTRKSGYTLNSVRQIVDPLGNALLSDGGGPIAIPLESFEINVDRKGVIRDQNGQLVARLQIISFGVNENALIEEAGQYYRVDSPAITPEVAENIHIQHKSTLNSNVNLIGAMQALTIGARIYQQNNKLLQEDYDQTMQMIAALNQ